MDILKPAADVARAISHAYLVRDGHSPEYLPEKYLAGSLKELAYYQPLRDAISGGANDGTFVYAGAGYDLLPFLVSGCRRGILIDVEYGSRMLPTFPLGMLISDMSDDGVRSELLSENRVTWSILYGSRSLDITALRADFTDPAIVRALQPIEVLYATEGIPTELLLELAPSRFLVRCASAEQAAELSTALRTSFSGIHEVLVTENGLRYLAGEKKSPGV